MYNKFLTGLFFVNLILVCYVCYLDFKIPFYDVGINLTEPVIGLLVCAFTIFLNVFLAKMITHAGVKRTISFSLILFQIYFCFIMIRGILWFHSF